MTLASLGISVVNDFLSIVRKRSGRWFVISLAMRKTIGVRKAHSEPQITAVASLYKSLQVATGPRGQMGVKMTKNGHFAIK